MLRPLPEPLPNSSVLAQAAMNLNYNWGFGSTAGFCLLIQISSGAFLSMHYASETHYAFSSVEHHNLKNYVEKQDSVRIVAVKTLVFLKVRS